MLLPANTLRPIKAALNKRIGQGPTQQQQQPKDDQHQTPSKRQKTRPEKPRPERHVRFADETHEAPLVDKLSSRQCSAQGRTGNQVANKIQRILLKEMGLMLENAEGDDVLQDDWNPRHRRPNRPETP